LSRDENGTVFGEFGEGIGGALGGGTIRFGCGKGSGVEDTDVGEDISGQVPGSLAGLDDENLAMLALVFELPLKLPLQASSGGGGLALAVVIHGWQDAR
jgi:hypothetical protein